jgi:hypothetical protein
MPRDSTCVKWCFTWNNFPENYKELIQEAIDALDNVNCVYLSLGEEVGESGTPHLQGFILLDKPISRPSEKLWQSHWTKVRHFDNAIDYTQKGEQPKQEWDRFKTKGPNFGLNAKVWTIGERPEKSNQGKRNDFEVFRDDVRDTFARGEFMTVKRARLEYPEMSAKYPSFVRNIINDFAPLPHIDLMPLRPWMQHLNHLLQQQANRRDIIFVVDYKGNSGKSWFCDYFKQQNDDVQVLTPGKAADIAWEVQPETRVFLFDCPRGKVDTFNYFVLEQLKDKRIKNSKWESYEKYLWQKEVHVVVFMNQDPDMSQFSEDRIQIVYPPQHDPDADYGEYTRLT